MQPGGGTNIEPTATETRPKWRRVLAGVLALGVVIAVLALIVWWRRGGARQAVEELAERGAVALADVIVEEIFPAA